MNTQEKSALLHRLKTLRGHLDGVSAMLEQRRSDWEVYDQIEAVQSALCNVAAILFADYLKVCQDSLANANNLLEREQVMAQIIYVCSHHLSTPIESTSNEGLHAID